MPNEREVRDRIKSVKNISQVTRALQAVSASKVRKAMEAMMHTRPYATKAWQVLTHIAAQPGRDNLHPLLTDRDEVENVLIVLVSGDRGLAGAYNANIVRYVMGQFEDFEVPLHYITVGRKGRDLMIRRRQNVVAEFIKVWRFCHRTQKNHKQASAFLVAHQEGIAISSKMIFF